MKLLQITLQKRIEQVISKEAQKIKESPFNLVAFGHYDRIETSLPQDGWHGFRPVAHLNKHDNFIDDYTIRLVFPELDASKMDFGFWEKISDPSCCPDYASEFLYAYQSTPFLAICLINLADGFISKLSNEEDPKKYAERVIKELQGSIEAQKEDSLKYTIYFALGYTDVVVLFRSNSYISIQNQIDALRSIYYATNEEDTKKVVSSTYTIYGLISVNVKDDKYELVRNNSSEKILAYCDITLALNHSEQELFENWEKYKTTYLKEGNAQIYSISGNYDWRLSLENISLGDFQKLFGAEGFFSDYALGDKSCIRSLSTKILFPVTNGGHDNVKQEESYRYFLAPDKEISDKIDEELEEFEKRYGEMVREHHIHRRAMRAMQSIRGTFGKLIKTSHGYEVRKIVGKFFCEFLSALNSLLLNKNDWSHVDIQNFEQCFQDFRDAMSFLLFDLWRSDQPFFEGQTIAHPSIGSTAKLLFAYNYIFNYWTSIAESSSKKGFSFLITSGGCDETITRNPFAYFPACDQLKSDIGIIRIPEASLYDVRGTLLRLAHEFFHLRGERKRRERASFYLRGLCHGLINHLKDKVLYPSIIAIYIKMHTDEHEEEIEDKEIKEGRIDGIIQDILNLRKSDQRIVDAENEFAKKIFILLWSDCKWIQGFEEEFAKDKQFYYGKKFFDNCSDWLHSYIIKGFFKERGKEISVIEKMAEALSEFQIEMAPNLEKIIYGEKWHGPFSELIWIFDKKQKAELVRKNTQKLKEIVENYFNGDAPNDDSLGFPQFTPKKALEDGECLSTIFKFLYRECFADCLAVKALNYKSPFDYIFQFLYENRGIDAFFEIKRDKEKRIGSVSTYVAWRLSVVCDVCFGEKNVFMTGSEENFKTAFNEAFNIFYPILHLNLDLDINNAEPKINTDETDKYIRKYGNSLYEALLFIRKYYLETSGLPYLQCLREYLMKCLDDEKNKAMFHRLSSQSETISMSKYSKVDDKEITYLMDGWLDIYLKKEKK